MSRTWFTADTHFGHAAVIDYCKRPFANVGEMDAALVARWNEVVAPSDDVWHLGDVCFRGDPARYLDALHGRIHVVYGNHDDPKKIGRTRAAWAGDVKYLRADGWRFFLSHYAHRVWRNSVHGSFHLFGHSHGDLPGVGRSMDVGVDCNGYRPVVLEEVVARLMDRDPTDHHEKRRRRAPQPDSRSTEESET